MTWWTRYWFRPAPYIDLAMVRIIVVGTQLALLLFYNGNDKTFNEAVMQQYLKLPVELYAPIPAVQLFIFPFGLDFRPGVETLLTSYYVAIGAGTLTLVGLLTNWSALLFALANIFLIGHFYSYTEFHHPEAPMMIALLLLAVSPSGRVLSVDAWWRKRHYGAGGPNWLAAEGRLAGWPIRVLQWMFVLIYLSAVGTKLILEGGLDWLNGFTLQYHLIGTTLERGTLLGLWFSEHHTLIVLAQFVVVLFQTTFVLAVLFPPSRWIYVPLGVGFHIANILLLNAVFYEWIALYSIFIPWQSLGQLLVSKLIRGAAPGGLVAGAARSAPASGPAPPPRS